MKTLKQNSNCLCGAMAREGFRLLSQHVINALLDFFYVVERLRLFGGWHKFSLANVRDVPRAGERRLSPSELLEGWSGGGPYESRPIPARWHWRLDRHFLLWRGLPNGADHRKNRQPDTDRPDDSGITPKLLVACMSGNELSSSYTLTRLTIYRAVCQPEGRTKGDHR